jgi:putative ABC transport system substrate-binding protein
MQSGRLKRREFITLLGGAAAVWPLAALAQPAGRLPTIGFFSAGSATAVNGWVAALVARLHELGWVEGRTVAIEYRYAEGRHERLAEFAAEFVRRKVDVIVTHSTEPVVAAKQATTVIPIVFATAVDPVGNGLVASLARPGGNVTGLSSLSVELAGKRIELLRKIVPGLRRLAIMANADAPGAVLEMTDGEAAAHTLGLEVVRSEIRRAEDIAPAFEVLKGRVDALFAPPEPLVLSNRISINILAAAARLPTMYGLREYVEAGGLMSYGTNIRDSFRRAGDYVDKILRGAKPADIPVEQPTKFDLVVNFTTAKALGLTVPDELLALANEVIE